MGLTKLQFWILDAMADGTEPFSMVYVDVQEELGAPQGLNQLAGELCSLISRGLVASVDCKNLSAEALTLHYANLVQELERDLVPFYYSKGEYFFEMTAKGRNVWRSSDPALFQAD